MNIWRLPVAVVGGLGVIASLTAVSGCGSSTPAASVELRGEYDATGPGELLAITFFDATHYAVKWNRTCPDEAFCTDWGTYLVDAAGTTVTLTSATTGDSLQLPFAVIASESLAPDLEGGVAPLGVTSLTGSGQGLASGNGNLSSTANVASTVQVAGQPMSLVTTNVKSHSNSNEAIAYSYFTQGKGLKNFQAAGIVGNLVQESSVVPSSAQLGGGPGRGIAQWSLNQRWNGTPGDNLFAFAKTTDKGQSPMLLMTQLDFIWWELTNKPAFGFSQLQASSNVTEATDVFMSKYEICGACDSANRLKFAQQALASFGDGDANILTMSMPALSSAGNATNLSDGSGTNGSGTNGSGTNGSGGSPDGGTSLDTSTAGVNVCGSGNDNVQAANYVFSDYSAVKAMSVAEESWQEQAAGSATPGLAFLQSAIAAAGVSINVQNGPDLVNFLSGLPYDEFSPSHTSVSAYPGDIVVYSNETGLQFCAVGSTVSENCTQFGVVITGGDAATATAAFNSPPQRQASLQSMLSGTTVSPDSTTVSTFRVYHAAGTGCD